MSRGMDDNRMTDREQEVLLALVRRGMGHEAGGNGGARAGAPAPADRQAPDWATVLRMATRQAVPAIAADGLPGLDPLPAGLTPELRMKAAGGVIAIERRYARYEQVIGRLAGLYAEGGFRMMVLKGYGLSLGYPVPSHRPTGDIDIWLFGDWKAADAMLASRGVKIDNSHHHHSVFHIGGEMVENHYDFLNIHAHRSNRRVERRLQELAPTGYETITVAGQPVCLPSPDFNALFLLRHAAAHFAADHITLRHLLDWGTFAERSRGRIDWPTLEAFSKELNMDRFLYCINAICIEDLGFDPTLFPAGRPDAALKRRVLADILSKEFDEAPPRSFFGSLAWRYRRWRANAWKHRIVYDESLFRTFFVQLWSHLLKPASFRLKFLSFLFIVMAAATAKAAETPPPARQPATERREAVREHLETGRERLRENSILRGDETFRWQKLIAPMALIAVGAFGVENGWYDIAINNRIRDFATTVRGDRYVTIDNYLQYFPAAANLGLGFVTPARRDFRERLAVTATASVIMAVLVNTIKYTVQDMRPDDTTRNSFPSGHTATAFMGAELVRREYGGWYGAGAYGVATVTALLRIYNNRHWSNDLLGGAAIGILSANAAYWLLPVERRLFHWDGAPVTVAAMPYCAPSGPYHAGLALTVVF